MLHRLLTLLIVLCAAAAAVAALAGMVPFAWIQPLGGYVRRPEDMTPERYARYLQVCWFFAVVFGIAGLWLARRRQRAIALLEDLRRNPISGGPPWASWELLMLAAVSAVAVALRWRLLDEPMAYDEAYTYVNFASRPWYEAIGDYNSTNNHLLNTFLMHWCARWFGPREWALRLPVFLVGCLLPSVVFIWARNWLYALRCPRSAQTTASTDGRGAAAVAAALAAVSPALITYSVDARGYMFVVCAAVVFDDALWRLLIAPSARAASLAALAMAAGLCAMPIMLYAVLASLGWYLLSRRSSPDALTRMRSATDALAEDGSYGRSASVSARSRGLDPAAGIVQRVQRVLPVLFVASVIVALFYAPAYIFRGLLFLRDPIMQAEPGEAFLTRLDAGWRDAATWWIDGPFPTWLWFVLGAAGLVHLVSTIARDRSQRTSLCSGGLARWFFPLLAVLALNLLQRVAPPPRLFLHLSPWIFFSIALGAESLLSAIGWRRPAAGMAEVRQGPPSLLAEPRILHSLALSAVAVLVLLCGSIEAIRRPVLFNPGERAAFVSVPDLIERLHAEVGTNSAERHVLLAPLPCDLPAIFYMDRRGFRLPINQRPRSGDRVWLIVPSGQSPADVLRNGLIRMEDLTTHLGPWRTVEEFSTLRLVTAAVLAD